MSVAVPELYCPFAPAVSPHAASVQRDAVAWALRMGVATPRTAKHLDGSRIGWLVARAFPTAARAPLGIAADWTTLFCLLDDRAESLDPLSLAAWLDALRAVLRDGAPPGDDPMARALSDLRARLAATGDARCLARFTARVEDIFVAFSWEAIHRRVGVSPSVDAYRVLREVTVGLHPLFELGAVTDGIQLPDDARAHPTLRRMAASASRAVGWANDLFTCEKEQREGEVHNLVLVLVAHERIPLDVAASRVAAMHDDEVRALDAMAASLPSFGDGDPAVRRHVALLRSWVRGHLDWARETARYRPTHAPSPPC